MDPTATPTSAPTEAPTAPTATPTSDAPTEGPTNMPTPGPTECEDYTTTNGTEWHDSDSEEYTCDWYSEDDHCDAYGDSYEYDGYTANEVCCTCGGGTGGTNETSPTQARTNPEHYDHDTTETPTDAPTDEHYDHY